MGELMKVYQSISAVAAQLARDGIGKTRKNQQQGYAFRGIDEVMNALAPLLAAHKLIIFPRMIARTCEARETKSGGHLYSVTVEAEFDFVSAEDGSKHTARTFGEGMDSADKATNKAMSAAYKYAAFLTFCIPVEGGGDADSDAITPEPTRPFAEPVAREPPAKPSVSERASAGIVDPKVAALNNKPLPPKRGPSTRDSAAVRKLVLTALEFCGSRDSLVEWYKASGPKTDKWQLMLPADQAAVTAVFEAKVADIKAAAETEAA